ncbi:unnamed protein product [Ectocarpus fasciculatus]
MRETDDAIAKVPNGAVKPARAHLERGLGTRAIRARGGAAGSAAIRDGDPPTPQHRRNLTRNLGTRDIRARELRSRGLGTGGRGLGDAAGIEDDDSDLVGGRPPPLSAIADDEADGAANGPFLLSYRNGGGAGGRGSDSNVFASGSARTAAYDSERHRALLTKGGFFVMHGRFGNQQMRFVWMSHDLGTILWRCCGHTAVKGSAKTTLFDFVHLGFHKGALATANKPAGAAAAAAAAENAMNQIVLTGGARRNKLVLELDGGNADTDADVVQTWFEAFNFAVNFANTEVISRMLQSSGRRRSTLTQAAAARRSSLNSALPVPLAQANSTAAATTAVGRGATTYSTAADDALAPSTPAEALGGGAGVTPPRTKSRPLAALRPAPSSLPPPPPPAGHRAPVDDASPSSSIGSRGSGGSGSRGGGSGKHADWAGSMTSSQGASFVRPPPIDTSNMAGFIGPASPPPRGQPARTLSPPPSMGAYDADGDADFDREEHMGSGHRDYTGDGKGVETRERKEFLKSLATEAATVINNGTLTKTNFDLRPRHDEGETSSHSSSNMRASTATGGSAGSSRSRRESESRNKALSLPFRQLIAHHAPSVASHHALETPTRRPASPRARVGAVRRGSGCDGLGFGGGVGMGVGGARWATGKPLSGTGRRGSGGTGDSDTDKVLPDGVRWASSKPAINTRSPTSAPAQLYRERAGGADGRVPIAIAANRQAEESESGSSTSPPPRSRAEAFTTARSARSLQERGGTTSPTRGFARATARRLSALGAKAVGGIGLAGTGSSSGPAGMISRSPPPPPPPLHPPSTTAIAPTGGDSPGARGDGPPPPPSQEQRRRMSAAPLTEQQLLQVQSSSQPQESLPRAGGTTSPPPTSGASRRRSSAQQRLLHDFVAMTGARDAGVGLGDPAAAAGAGTRLDSAGFASPAMTAI